jgi:hypothetical protein
MSDNTTGDAAIPAEREQLVPQGIKRTAHIQPHGDGVHEVGADEPNCEFIFDKHDNLIYSGILPRPRRQSVPVHEMPIAADDNDAWFCEEHPQHLMGHDGCTGAGVPQSARILILLNMLRLSEQRVREANRMRDEMASHARTAAALALTQAAPPHVGVFHTAWANAKNAPDYDKKAWAYVQHWYDKALPAAPQAAPIAQPRITPSKHHSKIIHELAAMLAIRSPNDTFLIDSDSMKPHIQNIKDAADGLDRERRAALVAAPIAQADDLQLCLSGTVERVAGMRYAHNLFAFCSTSEQVDRQIAKLGKCIAACEKDIADARRERAALSANTPTDEVKETKNG